VSSRTHRVNELVRLELSEIIRREMKDPRVGLASISRVEVSRDLSHARIGVSVLGPDEDREDTVAALQHARGFLRSSLARRTRLRTVPELAFELDRGAEHSQHMSDLLESLHHDEPDDQHS